MRAALRLNQPSPANSPSPSPSPPRPPGRHRFVRDGEVPVVVVNARHQPSEAQRSALTTLKGDLAREHEARLAAEKALEHASATIRQLQTRLVHAEMNWRDARSAPAPAPAPERLEPEPEQARAPRPSQRRVAKLTTTGRHAEDKPIEWWKPGWKERFRAGKA